MTPRLLDILNAARAAGDPAVLVRRLVDGQLSLLVGGMLADGPPLDAELMRAADGALRQDRSVTVATADGPVFLQIFNPSLRLVIVGAVHIAQALAKIAGLAGYAVTIVDPRRAFATEARFADMTLIDEWPDDALTTLAIDRRTAVVTLTHDPKLDDPALDVALNSEAFYVAALGSRRTHAGRLERLAALGHGPTTLARIKGPAGLDIGAVSPAEIAVSIMAEMTAELRRAKPIPASAEA